MRRRTILVKQRLFVSGVIISRDNERFIFTGLGIAFIEPKLTNAASNRRGNGLTTTIVSAPARCRTGNGKRQVRWRHGKAMLTTEHP